MPDLQVIEHERSQPLSVHSGKVVGLRERHVVFQSGSGSGDTRKGYIRERSA